MTPGDGVQRRVSENWKPYQWQDSGRTYLCSHNTADLRSTQLWTDEQGWRSGPHQEMGYVWMKHEPFCLRKHTVETLRMLNQTVSVWETEIRHLEIGEKNPIVLVRTPNDLSLATRRRHLRLGDLPKHLWEIIQRWLLFKMFHVFEWWPLLKLCDHVCLVKWSQDLLGDCEIREFLLDLVTVVIPSDCFHCKNHSKKKKEKRKKPPFSFFSHRPVCQWFECTIN